jgi:hypothetical protein
MARTVFRLELGDRARHSDDLVGERGLPARSGPSTPRGLMIGECRLDKAGETIHAGGAEGVLSSSILPFATSITSHRDLAAVVLALVLTHQLHEFAFAAVPHLGVKRITVGDQYPAIRIPGPPVHAPQWSDRAS